MMTFFSRSVGFRFCSSAKPEPLSASCAPRSTIHYLYRGRRLPERRGAPAGLLIDALKYVIRPESTYMVESIDGEASPEASREIASRRERKRERTRGEIYSAAMNLFLRRGFDAVTIEEICAAADVARATFFLHFPAKEGRCTEYAARAKQALARLRRASHGTATATFKAALKRLAESAMQQP